jgi:serine/threonine protein kinase
LPNILLPFHLLTDALMTLSTSTDRNTQPASEWVDALPAGAHLDGFEVERVIGSSGFGIVYLARDLALDCQVAIKEYLPASIARRGDRLDVVLRDAQHADGYQQGLRAFMQEAQMLARCDHPSLLRVTRLWQAQGTAYRAMPYYVGRNLLDLRHGLSTPPDEGWLRALLDDLTGALEVVHDTGLVHRRVMPANILVRADDRPVLLDFDAVRYTLVSDKAQSLMAALDPSYAPESARPAQPELPQTAASDLHALAATIHFCITGQSPALAGGPGARRDSLEQVLSRLRSAHPGLNYSRSFVSAIDRALDADSTQWPRTAAEFRSWLRGDVVSPPSKLDLSSFLGADEPEVPDPLAEKAAKPDPDVPLKRARPSSAALDAAEAAIHAAALASAKLPAAKPQGIGPKATAPAPAFATNPPASGAGSEKTPPTAIAKDDEEGDSRLEFFPTFDPLPGSDFPSQRAKPSATTPRPAREPAMQRAGMRMGEPTFDAPAFDEPRRARAVALQRRSSGMLPWGIGLVVLGAALFGAWKVQEQRRSDRVLIELAKSASPSDFAMPGAAPATPADTPSPSTQSSTTEADSLAADSLAAEESEVASIRELPPTPASPSTGTRPAPSSNTTRPDASPASAGLPRPSPNDALASTQVADVALPDEPTSAGPTRSSAPPAPAPKTHERTTEKAEPRAPVEAVARSPREACGTRSQFALYRCMQVQCARGQWSQHTSCKRLRESDDVEG